MLKKVIILFVASCLLFAGAYGARKLYRKWNHNRLVNQGREYLVKGDIRNAGLCLQRAVKSNRSDPDLGRLMADYAEVLGQSEAVAWRERVVSKLTNSVPDRLALAATALRFSEPLKAGGALNGIGGTNRNTVAFHQLAAAVAVATNGITNAQIHLQQALTLNPTNARSRLNLAVLKLQTSNMEGLRDLQAFTSDPEHRSEALRALVTSHMNRKELDQALGYAEKLRALPEAGLGDRLMHLEVLNRAQKPTVNTTLKQLQTGLTNATDIFRVATWMMGQQRHGDVLSWASTLPTNLVYRMPVPTVIADCYIAGKHWPQLEAFLRVQNWGAMDHVRLANLSCAYRQLQQTQNAKGRWTAAVELAADRLERQTTLLRLAGLFGWEPEAEELLFGILDKHPREVWAFQVLARRLQSTGNTRSMHRLLARQSEIAPSDVGVKNNLAVISLLLNVQPARAHVLAREVYQADPRNPAYNSTYAYSLHVQGLSKEALAAIQRLSPQQLEDPGVALYYGVILAANGDRTRAIHYLDLASKANLMPEEKTLLLGVRG
jgi:tetratricopeptide (TPR) repeat protein